MLYSETKPRCLLRREDRRRMAETLVSLAVKLTWIATREWIRNMIDLSGTIENIMAELRTMEAFLKMVDDYEESNLLQEQFIWEVRDLAHQVEDAIDSYILLCSESLQENGFLPLGNYLINQTRNVGARFAIAEEVGKILPKFEAARKRFNRYDKICSRNGSTFEAGQSSTSSVSKSQRWHNPQDDGHFNENLVGIEGPKAELIQRLAYGVQKLQVVQVVGMGGMGKTTLVRKVYEDDDVKKRFQRHLWINFSTNSKPEELFKEVIEKLYEESRQPVPERLGTMKSLDMKHEINRLLINESYLIILDDVKALEKWKACCHAFPQNDHGSRVIITTQDADVAQGSANTVYQMKALSDKDSQKLFCLNAFDGGDCPGHLSETRDIILKKCGGMPLGIAAIGSLLRDKNTVAEWKAISNSLGIELEENEGLRSLDKILSRCYQDISRDLKPCFLYMSIFPGDHPIEHLKLIRLWVAEGFVAQGGGRTSYDVAENYLSGLLSRNLIQVAERRSDGRVKSYRIHGLMREILTTKSKALNFVARNTTIDSYCKIRRLSVQNSYVNLQGTCSLRSLLLFDVEKRFERSTMPVLFNRQLKLLTVLDLQGANVEEFPLAITDLLNLRYLSLRDTMVKDIPKSIRRLQKLETLDLKRTKVRKLPSQTKHLRQLQNLLLYTYGDDKNDAFPSKHGFQAPEGIGLLTSLQKLCFVEAGKGSSGIVVELGQLTELRRLGIIKLSTKVERELWSSIQKMTQLRALSVTASKGETMDLQGLNYPPECLERLYLTGALNSFPQWIQSPSLQNLVKIFLKSSNLSEESLERLGNLQNLVHIQLHQVYNGIRLCFRRGKFLKLKILGLRKLEYVERVDIEEKSMEKLEKFLIQECPRLKTLPLGINGLSKLRVLDFVDMPEEVYMRIQPSTVEGGDFGNIRHIPQVNFTTNEDQVWIVRRVCTHIRNTSASEFRADKLIATDIMDFWKK